MPHAAAYFFEQTLEPLAMPHGVGRRSLVQTERRFRQARPLLQAPLARGVHVRARDASFAASHDRFEQRFRAREILFHEPNHVAGETPIGIAETVDLLPA